HDAAAGRAGDGAADRLGGQEVVGPVVAVVVVPEVVVSAVAGRRHGNGRSAPAGRAQPPVDQLDQGVLALAEHDRVDLGVLVEDGLGVEGGVLAAPDAAGRLGEVGQLSRDGHAVVVVGE